MNMNAMQLIDVLSLEEFYAKQDEFVKVAGNVESFNIISQTGFFSPALLIK